jgi:hypothetical protein
LQLCQRWYVWPELTVEEILAIAHATRVDAARRRITFRSVLKDVQEQPLARYPICGGPCARLADGTST